MSLLTNYLENEYIQKSYPLKAADFVLTPYRKIFGGEERTLIVVVSEDSSYYCDQSARNSSSGWLEKALYAIPAIIAAPFALIAAFAKYFFLSPVVVYKEKSDVESISANGKGQNKKSVDSQNFKRLGWINNKAKFCPYSR